MTQMNRNLYWRRLAMVCLLIAAIGIMETEAQTRSSPQSASASIADSTFIDAMTGEEQAGMTLYDLLVAGGWVMVLIFLLSILALALVIYFSLTLNDKKLIPEELVRQIRHYLREGRFEDIFRLTRRNEGMLAKVIFAGMNRRISDPSAVSSTMESVGLREGERLMRQVRYLSEIATVAPMLGILGTVLGMIKAFNFIAFDISAVKPVALASAVAQALVTTAAGLIVAIPCMAFFFYFRGRMQTIIGRMEEIAVEIAEHISDKKTRKK